LEVEVNALNKQRADVDARLRELDARAQKIKARKNAQQRLPLSYAGKRLRDSLESGVPTEVDSEAQKRSKLSSTIVESKPIDPLRIRSASGTVVPSRSSDDHAKALRTLNPEDNKRSKRVFGLLLGTLQRAQTELEKKTDAARRREQAENKAENKAVHEFDAYAASVEKLLQVERDKELSRRAELDVLRDEKELQLLQLKWKLNEDLLSHWYKTEAHPPIYYRPKGVLKTDRVEIAKSGVSLSLDRPSNEITTDTAPNMMLATDPQTAEAVAVTNDIDDSRINTDTTVLDAVLGIKHNSEVNSLNIDPSTEFSQKNVDDDEDSDDSSASSDLD